VEEHLADCDDCRQRLETFRVLRRLVHNARPEAAEAESALARVMPAVARANPAPVPETPTMARVTPLAPPRRARRWPRLTMVGLGAAAMAAVALWVIVPARELERTANEVAEVHARARNAGRWVENSSEDPSVLAGWLEHRVSYALPPFPTGDGFALRGARVEALQGARVATAVYEVRKHWVDVFAWPSGEGDVDPVPTVTGSWTVCRWAHGGVSYWMVSDAGSDDLKRLATFLKEQRT
jgi:anti-sigma factor RsiW